MSRVKRGPGPRRRHKAVLKETKGFYGSRHSRTNEMGQRTAGSSVALAPSRNRVAGPAGRVGGTIGARPASEGDRIASLDH